MNWVRNRLLHGKDTMGNMPDHGLRSEGKAVAVRRAWRCAMRVACVLVTALAVLWPGARPAMATQTSQDQTAAANAQPAVAKPAAAETLRFTQSSLLRNVVDPATAYLRTLPEPTRAVVDTSEQNDDSQPVIDADGYQQWKDDSSPDATDEGIGWKLDTDGTLHIRPWKGETGTTGYASLDNPLSQLPWYAHRDDIKNIESSGTIYLNASSDLLFYGCKNLESLEGLKNWDASKLLYGRAMFQDCTSLKNLQGLENWHLGSATGAGVELGQSDHPSESTEDGYYAAGGKGTGMFRGCSNLTDLSALADWRFPTQGGSSLIAGLFQDCISLENLHGLENWNVAYVGVLSSVSWYPYEGNPNPKDDWDAGLFSGCSKLADISALRDWKLVTSEGAGPWQMGGMFKGCVKLTSIDALSRWDFSTIASVNSMFRDCTGLTDASAVAHWNLQYAQELTGMFVNCPKLERIGIPSQENGGPAFLANSVSTADLSNNTGLENDMPQIIREDGTYGPWTWTELNERVQQDDSAAVNMLHETGTGTVWEYCRAWILDYNANGGVGSALTQMIKLADSATLASCPYVRFGYTFLGWSTQPTDQTTLYSAGTSWRPANPQNSTHYTLYAQWKKLDSSETGPISADSGMLPGWQQLSSSGTQGTIPPNAVADVQFTNRYAPGSAAVSLKFTKLLDGNVPDSQFDFRLMTSSGEEVQTVHNVAAAVSFNPLTFTKTGEYTYFVNEIGNSSTVDMDAHVVEVKITVSGDPQNKGNLKAVVQLVGDTTFRNTSKPASLKLHKAVDGTDDTSKEFTFKVTLTGRNNQVVNGNYAGVAFKNGVGTVTMKAGENKIISGIPAYTSYTVTEENLPNGYALKSIEHGTGVLAAAGDASVTATNTYHAKPATATISATKYVQYGTNRPTKQMTANIFRFAMCEVSSAENSDGTGDASNTCSGIAEAANDANGSVTFPQLSFEKAGEHVYQIREENTGQDGVTYDQRTVTATVSVRDDGEGQLQASITYSGGAQVQGESAQTAVFVNQARQMSAMPHTGSAPWLALLVAGFAATFALLWRVNRRISKTGAR